MITVGWVKSDCGKTVLAEEQETSEGVNTITYLYSITPRGCGEPSGGQAGS